MKLKENVIIVLENSERYIILNKVNYENKTYFLAMGIKENKDIIPSKVTFVTSENEDGILFIKKVKDKNLMVTLTKMLKNK